MPKTDILKLIFHHDQRLEELAPSAENVANHHADALSLFTRPDPTYSTFYFSGTNLERREFGLNTLMSAALVFKALEEGLEGNIFVTRKGEQKNFGKALEQLNVNEAMVILAPEERIEPDIIHSFTGRMLRDVLEKDWYVLYKREARHGFDLQLFSKENIYTRFFYPLKALLPESFRFFSINGKRLSNEQKFYFETYTLHRPPHGFEEVFPETVL